MRLCDCRCKGFLPTASHVDVNGKNGDNLTGNSKPVKPK
jgi:hypothetical protein